MVYNGDHLGLGIISGPIWGSFPAWGSFAVGDHLRRCTVVLRSLLVDKYNDMKIGLKIYYRANMVISFLIGFVTC